MSLPMSQLSGKRILIGVTGGIAAYKAAELVRLITKEGGEVRVVMTEAAQAFVAPMTFQALSGAPVRSALFDAAHEAAMGHIELARWADLVLVAPASADFLARIACGMANDLLSTLVLATKAPLAVAPAMNQAMWSHVATVENVSRLERRGVALWGPAEGGQACGDTGPGRMLEPSELRDRVLYALSPKRLPGVPVLITAGPTREPIDPVRFVGNRSSGKMGFALASAFAAAGADVTLVSGPVALATPAGVDRVDVETAREMAEAVMARISGKRIFVGCAAVADYRPEQVAGQKIKKQLDAMEVRLVRNPDILRAVAALPSPPFTVGFAAETENADAHAEAKRRDKGVDMIAANLVGGATGGFERDENALTLLWEGGREGLPMSSKVQLAERLVERIAERYAERDRAESSR